MQDYVREEVLYREALALGLDRDDTIIRNLKGDSHFLLNIQDYLAKSAAFLTILSDCHLIGKQKLDLLSLKKV